MRAYGQKELQKRALQGCQLGSFGAKFLDFGSFFLPLALKISFGSFLLFGSFLALLEYLVKSVAKFSF